MFSLTVYRIVLVGEIKDHVVCMQPRLMWAPLGSWSVACLRRRRMVGGRDDEGIKEEVGTVK